MAISASDVEIAARDAVATVGEPPTVDVSERTRPPSRARSLFRHGAAGEPTEPERRRVERLVQWLRWLAIGSWGVLIQQAPWPNGAAVVYGVYALAVLYAAACEVLVRRASRIGAVSILTTLVDTFAVAAMCAVTGGLGSPIVPMFLLSVLATTIRFGTVEAFLIATLDALHAAVLYAAIGGASFFELAENVFYIYFVALLGGLLSAETRRQHVRAVKERERASLLLSLNREIVASSNLSELLSRILRMTLAVIPARGACVILRPGRADDAEPAVTAGRIARPSPEESERLLRDDALVESERRRRPVILDPAEAERCLPAAWRTDGERSHLTFAAIRGASPLGMLVMVGEGGALSPSDEELRLLGAVAEETAIAIEKARLGGELVAAQTRSRELLRRIIDAEEAERRRIAGELHDRMGKRFFEFYYDVRLLQGMSVDRDSASSEILARIIESARECAGEIRTLMNDLRPSVLDDFGFLEALKEFMTGIAARGELEVTLAIDEAAPSAGPEADLMLFRVLQEAVFNARKHASAKRVEVEFGATADRALRLVVRDDGRGFDLAAANPGHFGLLYMKERAEACGGEFAVRSRPRLGTEVEVRVAVPR